MGGPIDRGQVALFSWELPISQIRFELKSNVVPIGMIKTGIHYHRALLFKVRTCAQIDLYEGKVGDTGNNELS